MRDYAPYIKCPDIYYQLLHCLYEELPTYTRMWSVDLGREFTTANWQTSFHFTHKSMISCYAQEKSYKLFSRWYKDPLSLHKIFPSVPATCWRCGSAEGNYLHIWWECSRIKPFWTQGFKVFNTIYNHSLRPTPVIALLSMLPGLITSQKWSLLCFFLSPPRQLIPMFLKTTTVHPPLYPCGFLLVMI